MSQSEKESVHKRTDSNWTCCHFKDLPNWLQDNEFIEEGYRPPLKSIHTCFKSIFKVHTETGNIWTHLVPCFIFLLMGIHWFLTILPSEATLEEKFVFVVYFTGSFACFALSAAYHTFQCHSESIGKLFCKFDYLGINLIIMGSFYPWLYYCFYCNEIVKRTYYLVTLVLGSISIAVSSMDRFNEMQCRSLRASVFAVFALSGVLPVAHYAVTNGFLHAVSYASVGWVILMGLLHVSGGIVYTGRFPERLCPGKFNILFQSHQLFHVLVSAAAFVYYYGVLNIFFYREIHTQCEDSTIKDFIIQGMNNLNKTEL